MMNYTAEEKAIIWLCGRVRAEYRERVAILRAAKNPRRILSDWEKVSSKVIKDGNARVYNIDCDSLERDADALVAKLDACGYFAITLLSEDYPESLKAIPDPPLVLFGAGNRALLRERKFCIVGSRITPPWAEKQAKEFSRKLSGHFTIVTGFAEGGDRAAIDGALPSGNLICVLPVGLNECYPAGHAALKEKVRKDALLLSEYAPNEKLKRHHFHARNRILAGLSEGVLVVSARERRSGALITSTAAAEYGRDVFAFPYNIGVSYGSGCNDLIKKGAYLTTSVEDILSVYGMTEEKEEETVSLSDEELRILELLRENGQLHTAILAERLGIPVYEASALLSALEIKNLVIKSGGNTYSAL